MNQYNNPKKSHWKSLVSRPYIDNGLIYETVIDVFKTVKENGDVSLRELTKKFDKVELKNIKVEIDEIDVSEELISKELKSSIDLAFDNIDKFHLSQLTKNDNIEININLFKGSNKFTTYTIDFTIKYILIISDYRSLFS